LNNVIKSCKSSDVNIREEDMKGKEGKGAGGVGEALVENQRKAEAGS